jgi:hypothetical protein
VECALFSKTINMNLKPIVCFLIPPLISCKLLRLYEEEEIVLKTATTNVQLENNTPLVKVKINGTETNFLFDTGATGSCITDTTIIQNFHKQQFANIGIALGADGKRVKNKKFSVALQSELFDATKSWVLSTCHCFLVNLREHFLEYSEWTFSLKTT